MSYKAGRSHIKWLQKQHKQAKQKIVFHCKNTVANYDKKNDTYDNGVVLHTFNDEELVGGGRRKKFLYDVKSDGCQVSTAI